MDNKIGKEKWDGMLKVRSPLTCTAGRGVCSHCYGLVKNKFRLPDIGANVGIMSALVTSEPATQLTMRTFHTSGSSNVKTESLIATHDQTVEIERVLHIVKLTANNKIYFLHENEIDAVSHKDFKKGEVIAHLSINLGDISTKFPTLENMVELREGSAVISELEGTVELVELKQTQTEKPISEDIPILEPVNNMNLIVKVVSDDGESKKYVIDLLNQSILVSMGTRVSKGQQLSSGFINYEKLYELLSFEEFVSKFISDISGIFESEGVKIDRVHFEILLTTMLSNYKSEDGVIKNRKILDNYDGLKRMLSSISHIGRDRSFIQHASLGYLKTALSKVLTDYNEIGHFQADKIALGEL